MNETENEEYEPCYKDSLAFEIFREQFNDNPVTEIKPVQMKVNFNRSGRFMVVNYGENKK